MMQAQCRPQQTNSDACLRKKGFLPSKLDDKALEKAAHQMDESKLYQIPLVPVHCDFDLVQEREHLTQPLRSMMVRERRAVRGKVVVLFAIRRPGCGSCRLHGMQLTGLNREMGDVAFCGAIKHGQGVDDRALLDFYQQYFRFPLFKDSQWKIFEAMGGRKISLWKALTSIPRLERRYKSRNVPNIPFGGDIWTQGGVLVFDKDGNLRHTYYEVYGEELDTEVLRKAIREARLPLSSKASISM